MPSEWQDLAGGCGRAGLSASALHVRYVALGGLASLGELDAYLTTGATMRPTEHDVAVHALNERFLELGSEERLPYLNGLRPE